MLTLTDAFDIQFVSDVTMHDSFEDLGAWATAAQEEGWFLPPQSERGGTGLYSHRRGFLLFAVDREIELLQRTKQKPRGLLLRIEGRVSHVSIFRFKYVGGNHMIYEADVIRTATLVGFPLENLNALLGSD